VYEVIRTSNINIAIFWYVIPCSLELILKNWDSVRAGFSLKLRAEPRLRVVENGVPKRIFWPKWCKLCRKLHNVEHNDLYVVPNIVGVIKTRRIRWAGHVAHMGEGRDAYRVLVKKSKGKRPLGRPRHRWEDNIKVDV
jgi:hypothetical protein